MDITREMLLERKSQMEDEKQQCVNQANALHGAIIDIDHWLTVLDQAEVSDQGVPNVLEARAEDNDGGQNCIGGPDGKED